MMTAAGLEALRASILDLASRAECIGQVFPGRALWGAEEGGALIFCIATTGARRELVDGGFLDGILLAAHTEAAAARARHVATRRALLSTDTRQ